jgi:hypothetical protein
MITDNGAAIGARVPLLTAAMRTAWITNIFDYFTPHMCCIIPLTMSLVGINFERPDKFVTPIWHLIDGDSERFLALFAHGHSDESVIAQWGNLCHSFSFFIDILRLTCQP